MRIAMIGTRGVPARYGGFETAVEEIGCRLVEAGHEVIVYCRGNDPSAQYRGMERIRLPAVRKVTLETLSHSFLSVCHVLWRRPDVAILFNAANAPLLPLIRLAGIPVAVHVDGLEWKRAKWGSNGRRYYLANERLATKLADELIADAVGIQNYYLDRYRARSMYIPYGAAVQADLPPALLADVNLRSRGYHLVVSRMEPENNVELILNGYLRSVATKPLVIVGSVPYPSQYEERLRSLAASDSRVRMLGSVWNQRLLDTLYAHTLTYIHGHSVGGTNPSLLRAMGAAAATLAFDVSFNKEVINGNGRLFSNADDLRGLIELAESSEALMREWGEAACVDVASRYTWSDVASRYELLCKDLISGARSRRNRAAPHSTIA